MPLYRMQVTLTDGADAFTDIAAVTTFYLDDLGPSSDPSGLAQDASLVFANFAAGWANPINLCEVRAYEITGALGTGPPVGQGSSPVAAGGESGSREVACCLSYYADSNQPRRRGRMYIGPMPNSATNGPRPDPILRDFILNLGDGILGLGGVDVSWVQYSPTDQANRGVTNYYVDNAWDTQRSRGLAPTERTERVVGPS